MYGMLLESVQHFVQKELGEEAWNRILEQAGIRNMVFTTHQIYPDCIMTNIAAACARVNPTCPDDETVADCDFMRFFGRCFVRFFSHYGYDKIVRATGRHFRDFLHGVDNLHHMMRFSYPRMVSPSLYVEEEDPGGAVLHYRSRRIGFTQYIIGQLLQIAADFYDLELNVEVVQETRGKGNRDVHVIFRLHFDNASYVHSLQIKKSLVEHSSLPPMPGNTFLRLFPFAVAFDRRLAILHVGDKLSAVLGKNLVGEKVTDHFKLRRPRVQLTWENILFLQKVVFELEAITKYNINDAKHVANKGENIKSTGGTLLNIASLANSFSSSPSPPDSNGILTLPTFDLNTTDPHELRKATVEHLQASRAPPDMSRRRSRTNSMGEKASAYFSDQTYGPEVSGRPFPRRHSDSKGYRSILLKGQMRHLEDWNAVIFLCMPLINDLDEMHELRLFLNDLSLHDLSRQMVLAGWQHSARLVHAYEKQEERSLQLERSLRLLDQWKQRGDELLYSMIPRSVATLLQSGADPVDTCETFNDVSVLFSDLVGFADLCATLSAMEAVGFINDAYTLFDKVIDQFQVYKVETVGTVYMLVGGAPKRRPDHLQEVGRAALSMIEKAESLQNLSTGEKIAVRIGIHVGPVVAGVVGIKTLRYCLFGDTVNTASRMQTNSLPGRILVSEACHERLRKMEFVTTFRGTTNIKGKGKMNTYWLIGYQNDVSL